MTDNTTVDMDDLQSFEAAFYDKTAPVKGKEELPTEKVEKEVVETKDDALETVEDKDAPAPTGDDDESQEDQKADDEDKSEDDLDKSEDDKEPEAEDKGKNRKSAQNRINELTKEKYEIKRAAEARELELIRRIEAIEAREIKETKQVPIAERLPQGAPVPTAVNESGEPLYPLGEFDPLFIQDFTKFTIEQKTNELEQKRAAENAQREIEQAKSQLQKSWQEKVEKAEEEIPEIREHMVGLVESFSNIDPAYGEYLAMTIMQSEKGPEVLEYLSQNIGEAQKIVASGPAAATLALGRLEAQLSKTNNIRSDDEEEMGNKKVSSAPPPPEQATRGRKGQTVVRPDTDDLKAFERVFYQK